ncbi:uncharacterized protein NECHADRAFT_86342 [Fusarium vanettenii 77-13-4]|uniref:Uncharacterized protein n=1 Tax=Fusarium vanettenii (strain ATCC MYA-4622 / CBS 123669 / FGSC 9596 / NRRL 45880 / 77-13-4) TaxID=660122 RepID=C7ZEY6_FUSV7|nr:uncharacterized protein NECHADRAFT_86342 [Fusarium vanettenii 77-13-4]EEU37478.1 hypothetical protein NECHADRAFT_86342 [Fusarium vanettenii 77-13-4]
MPDPDPKPPQLQQFRELKSLVSLYEKVFEKLLPPDASFERRSGEIRTRIDETWAQLSTARPEDVPKFQEKIVELSGSLKEIELGHNRQKERYEARLWKHYNALRNSVMKVLVARPEATPATTAKDGDPVIRKPTKKLSLSSKPSLSSPAKPSSSSRTPATPSVTRPVGKRKNPSSSLLTPEPKRHKPETTPRRHPRGSHTDQQDYQCITSPEPGQVYLAFWESSKQWVPILLLPMTDLERVGVSGSLDSLDLAEILPICYDQDSLTGERTWRDGYKDGQTLVTEREFPVIYFEGRAFPERSPVGWVAAKDLRKFDVDTADSHLVPQIRMVRKFLKERAANVSCDGAEQTSHEKDVSDDQPPQETSTVLNQDEQPLQVPPAPGTVAAPEASTNDAQTASGPTPESQPTPHTSATGEKSRPDATTEARPKEQSPGDTQSKPTEAQSLPWQKTPLRTALLVMADLTPSPREATPVSESERPQDTLTAMELDPTPQASADNAKPAPEAVMALDERAPTDESPGRTIKVEPDLDIPRNVDVLRDIEIISIASTEPEGEEEDDGETLIPESTDATLEPRGLPGPSKQPGAGRDRGSTQIRADTRDPPLPRSSPPPIHFTPLNSSTTSTPSGTSTSVPKTFAQPSIPSSEAHHRGSTNLSNSDQHLRNYGIKRVSEPTGTQSANSPRLQTPTSEGQTASKGVVRGTKGQPPRSHRRPRPMNNRAPPWIIR